MAFFPGKSPGYKIFILLRNNIVAALRATDPVCGRGYRLTKQLELDEENPPLSPFFKGGRFRNPPLEKEGWGGFYEPGSSIDNPEFNRGPWLAMTLQAVHRSGMNHFHRILNRRSQRLGGILDRVSQDGVHFDSQAGRNSLMRLRIRSDPL